MFPDPCHSSGRITSPLREKGSGSFVTFFCAIGMQLNVVCSSHANYCEQVINNIITWKLSVRLVGHIQATTRVHERRAKLVKSDSFS